MPVKQGSSLLLTQPVYDSVILPAGAAGVVIGQFFTIPFGQLIAAGIPKTYRHTNLNQASQLERGNQIQIDSLSMLFPRTAEAGAYATIADIDSVRAGNLRLRFGGDSDFLTVPIAAIPNAGMAPVYSTDAALAAAVNFTFDNGASVTQNRFFLGQTIVLESQESVRVTFENMDAIVAPIEVMFFLHGASLRPVR